MKGRRDDPLPGSMPNAFGGRPLDQQAIRRALDDLRHLQQFHTSDVILHHAVITAHQRDIEAGELRQRVELWLQRESHFLGLRGPLPGHPARGARWVWQARPT